RMAASELRDAIHSWRSPGRENCANAVFSCTRPLRWGAVFRTDTIIPAGEPAASFAESGHLRSSRQEPGFNCFTLRHSDCAGANPHGATSAKPDFQLGGRSPELSDHT